MLMAGASFCIAVALKAMNVVGILQKLLASERKLIADSAYTILV